MSNLVGGGFIPVIVYGNFTASSLLPLELITQSNIDILTQASVNIVVQS
jgi:hypothetical protein